MPRLAPPSLQGPRSETKMTDFKANDDREAALIPVFYIWLQFRSMIRNAQTSMTVC